MPEPLAPSVWSEWSVSAVRSALLQHERGIFRLSGMLADHVQRDDRIFSTLGSRVLGVLGLPFRVEPSDRTSNRRLAKKLAEDVGAWWHEAVPEATWAELLRWAHLMGFAIGELRWVDEDGGGVLPSLYIHHPQFVRWNEDAQRYELETRSGVVPITPGDGRWVLFAPHGSTRPHMQSALRALAIPFLIRSFTRRDWARRSEIEGVGVRKAKVPKQADPRVVDKFLFEVRALGAETTLRLPEGFDFEIAVADAAASLSFEKLLAHCDTAITLTLLGQNLTTQIEGGSFAAAGVHEAVQLVRIKSDVAMLSTVGRQQVVVPWAELTIPGFRRTMAPWPVFDATPPEELKDYANALQMLGQALPVLREAGIDIEPLLQRFELRMAEVSSGSEPVSPKMLPRPGWESSSP